LFAPPLPCENLRRNIGPALRSPAVGDQPDFIGQRNGREFCDPYNQPDRKQEEYGGLDDG